MPDVTWELGPYPSERILKYSLKPLQLSRLCLYDQGRLVGLDDTELLVPRPQSAECPPIHFYGLLKITSLDLLTAEGQSFLQYEIKTQMQKNGDTKWRRFQLANSSGYELLVWVRAVCSRATAFLTTNDHHGSLFMYSSLVQDRLHDTPISNRLHHDGTFTQVWQILSLDPQAYEKSQSFLQRWRIYKFLRQMKDEKDVPIHHRTVEWVIQRYIEQYASCHSVDSRLQLTRPRHLPRAEVLRIFAQHAHWLLAQHLVTSNSGHQLMNTTALLSFCNLIASSPEKWGLPPWKTPLAYRLNAFGGDVKKWKELLERLQQKTEKAPAKPPVEVGVITMSGNSGGYHYDSDYDSASDYYSASASDVETELSTIPLYCRQEPQLPPWSTIWTCPGCEYVIDLRNLTNEQNSLLPSHLSACIKDKKWHNTKDSDIEQALRLIVAKHYKTIHILFSGTTHRNNQNIIDAASYPEKMDDIVVLD